MLAISELMTYEPKTQVLPVVLLRAVNFIVSKPQDLVQLYNQAASFAQGN